MSNPTQPVPDFPAAALSGLSNETRATFTEQMAKAGYNRTEVEARLSGTPKTPSPQEIAETAQRLRDHWSGDKATLDAALAKLEAKEPGATSAVPESLLPPKDGEAYRLNYGDHASLMPAEDLAALHSEIVSGFQSAEIPASLGQPILDALLESADQTDGLNEVQVTNYRAEQRAMLAKAGDPNELIRLAAVGLIGMPQETVGMLRENGCLDSAQAISAFAAAGRAREYREARSGK